MKINAHDSVYRESKAAACEYTRDEIKKMRVLLRRLRFLEIKMRESGGLSDPTASPGAAFVEMELDALEFALIELGFVKKKISNTQKEKN